MDGEDWCGLTVRTHEGAVVGVVVGAFVEGRAVCGGRRGT
jgi:hypothetical protein